MRKTFHKKPEVFQIFRKKISRPPIPICVRLDFPVAAVRRARGVADVVAVIKVAVATPAPPRPRPLRSGRSHRDATHRDALATDVSAVATRCGDRTLHADWPETRTQCADWLHADQSPQGVGQGSARARARGVYGHSTGTHEPGPSSAARAAPASNHPPAATAATLRDPSGGAGRGRRGAP